MNTHTVEQRHTQKVKSTLEAVVASDALSAVHKRVVQNVFGAHLKHLEVSSATTEAVLEDKMSPYAAVQ